MFASHASDRVLGTSPEHVSYSKEFFTYKTYSTQEKI